MGPMNLGKFAKALNKKKKKVKKKKKKAKKGGLNPELIGKRPSERMRAMLALGASLKKLRPPIPVEPPFLFRIFKGCVQRMPLSLQSLNSNATFLLICDTDKKVVGWYGSSCAYEDRNLAQELGQKILVFDFSKGPSYGGGEEDLKFPAIIEDLESSTGDGNLPYLFVKLWTDFPTYRSKAATEHRRNEENCENYPASVGVLVRFFDGSYALRETAFVAPDESGRVGRLSFVPGIERDTLAVVNTGEQWDLWIARGVAPKAEEQAIAYVSALAASRASAAGAGVLGGGSGVLKGLKSPYLRIVRQGCERIMFRERLKIFTDFLPEGKTITWEPPAPPSSVLANTEKVLIATNSLLLDPMSNLAKKVIGTTTKLAIGGASQLDKDLQAQFSQAGGTTNKEGKSGSGAVSSGSGGRRISQSSTAFGSNISDFFALGAASSSDEKESHYGSAGGGVTGQDESNSDNEGPARKMEPRDASQTNEEAFAKSSAAAGTGGKKWYDVFFKNRNKKQLAEDTKNGLTLDQFLKSDDVDGFLHEEAVNDNGSSQVATKKKGAKKAKAEAAVVIDVDLIPDLQISHMDSQRLLRQAEEEPALLVGWQVEIEEGPGNLKGVHTITKQKKTPMTRKTTYQLSSYARATDNSFVGANEKASEKDKASSGGDESDAAGGGGRVAFHVWVRIKRGSKDGVRARPLRKIF